MLVDPEVMEQIGQLELKSRVVVDGFLSGKHRSTHQGGCCEFSQHRAYAPGDDVRRIDWQVYARNDRYVIRQFEEETNLQALIAVDTSGSMQFGMSTVSKLDYAKVAAACLSRLLLHQRDAIGVAMMHETSPQFIPPRQNASHLQSILMALQTATGSEAGNLAVQLRSCLPRMKRRGMLILFSDCFGDVEALGNAFRVIRAHGHDVIVFQILAPEETQFDFRHWTSFKSLESASERMRIDPAAVRDVYLRNLREHLERLETAITGIGGDYVRVVTNQNVADVLAHFMRNRQAKQSRTGSVAQRVVTI